MNFSSLLITGFSAVVLLADFVASVVAKQDSRANHNFEKEVAAWGQQKQLSLLRPHDVRRGP